MKRHKCLDMVDAELKEHNTRLVSNLLNENDVFILTEQIVEKRWSGKQGVCASHCPFCGKKLVRKKNALS